MCTRTLLCVLLGGATCGISDRRCVFFHRKRNRSDSKRYRAPLWGLWEHFPLGVDSPGKPSRESTSHTWPISLIFTALTITPCSQASCCLLACADSISIQLSSFAFTFNFLWPDRIGRAFPYSLPSCLAFASLFPFTPPSKQLPPSHPSPSPVQVRLLVPDRGAQCSFVISRA